MKPSRSLAFVMLSIAIALATAGGACAQGGVSLLDVGSAASPGSGAAATPVVTGIDPALPDVRYEWARRTGDVAVAKYFQVGLDTPSFSNPSIAGGGGACFGHNLLTMLWLARIVIPVQDDGIRHALTGSDTALVADVGIANGFSVKGPVDRGNLYTYRLHAYSAGARADTLARVAGHLQLVDAQGGYGAERLAGVVGIDRANPTRHHHPVAYRFGLEGAAQQDPSLRQQLASDVDARSRELALLDVELTGAGHSLFVYAIEEGFAVGVAGTAPEVPAMRFLVFDPNFPDESRQNPFYLLYFPGARRYAFDPGLTGRYAGTTTPLPASHGFYTGFLRHRPVHSMEARQFIAAHAQDPGTYVPDSAAVRY